MPIYHGMMSPFNDVQDNFKYQMAAGWVSGAMSTVVTNPLWMIRQRMQTEIIKGKSNSYSVLVREMWNEAGAKTFFRGTGLTLVKNVQMALLLPLFDRWTSQAKQNQGWSSHLIPYIGISATIAVTAAAAKIVSSSGVYPLDVIRTNVRFQEGKRIQMSAVTKELLQRKGGVMNLFRGIHLYWLSSAGMFAVMMTLQNLLKD
jgi:solute carrier family 25 folate transporter 32